MGNKTSLTEIRRIFNLQKKLAAPAVPSLYKERIDQLNRLEKMVKKHYKEMIEALSRDFGRRTESFSLFMDIATILILTKKTKKNLKKWMKPEKVKLRYIGKNYILNEPYGVVGIIAPFNVPGALAFLPLIQAIGAGNRVMMKISEHIPLTQNLYQSLISKYFKEEEIFVVVGGVEESSYFSTLAWDKLMFTGGTEIGKKVYAAATANLTPVILELGGKCPLFILPDANIKEAAQKAAQGRQINAGQICFSLDYVLIHKKDLDPFIRDIIAYNKKLYPTFLNNPEVTSIINKGSYDRLIDYIDQAKASGIRVMSLGPEEETLPDAETRMIPLTLIIEPTRDLKIFHEEAFGPLLSIYIYETIQEGINFINARPKALASYIFGKNKQDIHTVLTRTSSGNVGINDLVIPILSQPFGGVGASGISHQSLGREGFQVFSNQKSVMKSGFLLKKMVFMFLPPRMGKIMKKMLKIFLGLK